MKSKELEIENIIRDSFFRGYDLSVAFHTRIDLLLKRIFNNKEYHQLLQWDREAQLLINGFNTNEESN